MREIFSLFFYNLVIIELQENREVTVKFKESDSRIFFIDNNIHMLIEKGINAGVAEEILNAAFDLSADSYDKALADSNENKNDDTKYTDLQRERLKRLLETKEPFDNYAFNIFK